jgi:cytochrome c oxidase subunit II
MSTPPMILLSVMITLGMAGPSLIGQEKTSAAGGGAPITMSARKYEFSPNVIRVKQGDHVKLVITAMDRDHGFKLPAYGLNQRLVKGVATTVEFTADRPGTFPFECSVVCGLGHRRMKGQLIVEPTGSTGATATTPQP